MRAEFEIIKEDNNAIVSSEKKFEGAIALNILQKNSSDKLSIIGYCLADDSIDESKFSLTEDGYYTIHHIIIPTKKWLDNIINNITDILLYSNIYIIDNLLLLKYYYKTNELKPVDIEEVLEINCNSRTNIISELKSFFSYYYTELCLINFITYIFNSRKCKSTTSSKCSPKIEKTETVFRANTTLMFLNLIKYYVECKNFKKALYILETFLNCYKYCKDTLSNSSNCKCNG